MVQVNRHKLETQTQLFNFIGLTLQVDTLQRKESLFKITRILTEGIVDGRRESIKASEIFKKKSQEELFDRMDKLKRRRSNQTALNQNSMISKDTNSHNSSSGDEMASKTFNRDVIPDLWNSEDWQNYNRRLHEVRTQVIDKKGWPGFSAVFMVSAKDGDGIEEIKVPPVYLSSIGEGGGGKSGNSVMSFQGIVMEFCHNIIFRLKLPSDDKGSTWAVFM